MAATHSHMTSEVRSSWISGTAVTTMTTPPAIRLSPAACHLVNGSLAGPNVAMRPLKKTPTAPTGATMAVGA